MMPRSHIKLSNDFSLQQMSPDQKCAGDAEVLLGKRHVTTGETHKYDAFERKLLTARAFAL